MTTESLRQKHLDRTRNAIMDAAFELFAERGFTATTVEDIARRADIAPRTFFRYFATKESVLFDDAEDKIQRIRELLAQQPDDEPLAHSLVAVLTNIADQLVPGPAKAQLLCRLAIENQELLISHRRAMMDGFTSTLVAALSDRYGIPTTDLGLRAMVAAVVACIATATQSWLDDGGEGEVRPYLDQALTACRKAFNPTQP